MRNLFLRYPTKHGVRLVRTSKRDLFLKRCMADHYSEPKGFVGRQIIFRIMYGKVCYGVIAAGSATKFLPGRSERLGHLALKNIVNNTLYHVDKIDGEYPCRNFTTLVVALWRETVMLEWPFKYRDKVLAFETLVELPRSGELYKRDGWEEVGMTKGYTCKRTAGKGTDSWSGKRVWNTTDLRPKRVFVRHV